jgi:hypothetical protein
VGAIREDEMGKGKVGRIMAVAAQKSVRVFFLDSLASLPLPFLDVTHMLTSFCPLPFFTNRRKNQMGADPAFRAADARLLRDRRNRIHAGLFTP